MAGARRREVLAEGPARYDGRSPHGPLEPYRPAVRDRVPWSDRDTPGDLTRANGRETA
ncbi:hypothetical protein Aph01nite_30440 [Acrocarpospora phusangensis]|uniref:Uncharacterized protein n=1 Tax=Acrocarpospora phusangensis TaxID=1070424 RepID=A0A919Q904_9ACTN|nr:hypothetical protein [Acrocarpospora phusangensis]GIH24734.1 hypothetical protein Aph01nite_30440 [Acrocarpospora phusangensis]